MIIESIEQVSTHRGRQVSERKQLGFVRVNRNMLFNRFHRVFKTSGSILAPKLKSCCSLEIMNDGRHQIYLITQRSESVV